VFKIDLSSLNIDISIIISIIALIISLYSLYIHSLKPFKLKFFYNSPTFSLYKIPPSISGNDSGKTWWIPSFDIGMSFYNLGSRSGEILDVRIKAELKLFDKTETIYKYCFYPKWIVDYAKFQKDNFERFIWLETSVIREWYPILLKGNSENHIHLILENTRWEEITEGEMSYCLEVITSEDKKWKECSKYNILVTRDIYETGSTISPYNNKIGKYRKE